MNRCCSVDAVAVLVEVEFEPVIDVDTEGSTDASISADLPARLVIASADNCPPVPIGDVDADVTAELDEL